MGIKGKGYDSNDGPGFLTPDCMDYFEGQWLGKGPRHFANQAPVPMLGTIPKRISSLA
jgi:hypothetical protein